MRVSALRKGSLALACALAALASGCRSRHPVRAPPRELFGEVHAPLSDGSAPNGPLEAVDLAPFLAAARAIVVAHAEPPPTPEAPGRRVFLGVYVPGHDPVIASALGPSLREAVIGAAREAAPRVPAAASGPVRITLDIALAAEETRFTDEKLPPGDVGLDGYLWAGPSGAPGFILPLEIVNQRLYDYGKRKIDRVRLAAFVAPRTQSGLASTALDGKAYRFRTRSVVESVAPGRALPLRRGLLPPPVSETPDELIAAARAAADHLVRIIDDSGRFTYAYHPVEGKPFGNPYSFLRHSGTTYALLETYEELRDPRYLAAAERTLASLEPRFTVGPPHPRGPTRYLLDTFDEEQQKVGGAGLAMLAFAKHAALTGRAGEPVPHLEILRSLARFILVAQAADGHFRDNADLNALDGKKRKKDVIYYSGEATLGLLRLYALDPDPEWLAAARKAADFSVRTRDAGTTLDTQEHDHWLSYALNELYRLTRDQTYADHAFKIAGAILRKQGTAQTAPDPEHVGSFSGGLSAATAARLEAYAADIALARFADPTGAGQPDQWMIEAAAGCAQFLRLLQIDAEGAWFAREPALVEGAVRESLYNPDLRIDYDQHSISGWLHLARILRDPNYGRTGVPSQDQARPPSAPAVRKPG